MKHFMKFFGLLAMIMALALCLVACNDPDPDPDPDPPVADVEFIVDGVDTNGYVIVYPEGDNEARQNAVTLCNIIKSITGERPEIVSDTTEAASYEILVGKTNRSISQTLAADMAKLNAADYHWGYYVDGNSLAICATHTVGWSYCFDMLSQTLVVENDLILAGDLRQVETLTQAAYDQAIRDAANEAAKDKIATLVEAIGKFKRSNFYTSSTRYSWSTVAAEVKKYGSYTVDYDVTDVVDMSSYMGNISSPELTPTVGQHPRLLFTSEDIPSIKAAMENPENAAALKNIKYYVESNVDGKLDPITYEDPAQTKAKGARYNANYNQTLLSVIQAKAFWYAITGEQVYGYQAIYAMLNYLKTLDIGFYDSDQCRYYGHTAYVAALVYDWCYDLLTDKAKEYMALGIQNACFVGYSSLPDGATHAGIKSELGFPPTGGTGPVEGHGSELALLRDFLSVAIAIYDEYPSWYELIGGRMFDQYIPARNYFYESAGMYPEGVSIYAPFRFLGDLYSAWMLQSALGENPYSDEMARVSVSMTAHIFAADGQMFSTGDGNVEYMNSYMTPMCALVSSYLYDDADMRAYAKTAGQLAKGGTNGCANLSATEILLCGMNGLKASDNYQNSIDLITYNGGYYQQIILRNSWSADSPVVLMRGASRTTYGHSHQASGEFQIYYKGLLAGDDGVYDNYGSDHHLYYHKATIAHSCLLVFNPDLAKTNGGYYSGGQPKVSGPADVNDYQAFIDGDIYSTGSVIGVKYGYNRDGSAKYAYYANDLTQGYAVNKVNYVGRTMLTTFTDDANYPMVLFIYDRIDVPETDYTKSFLLQCVAEPTIDPTTHVAIVDNGEGKMILNPLLGCGSIEAHGDDDGSDPDRFWISTQNKNLPSGGGLSSGADGSGQGGSQNNGTIWGKIEIQTAPGNLSDVMLNVIYVTDSDNDELLDVELLRGVGYYGATAANQVAIFAFGEDGIELCTDAIEFSVEGLDAKDYYIGGLAEGTWNVNVGGKDLGNMEVVAGEQVLVFSSRGAGTVTVTPVDLAE